jgi:hypothetical protein
VKVTAEISRDISFQIPHHLSTEFQSFFQEFDKNLDSLDIRSYGIQVPTLEDVFLRVTKEKEQAPIDGRRASGNQIASEDAMM